MQPNTRKFHGDTQFMDLVLHLRLPSPTHMIEIPIYESRQQRSRHHRTSASFFASGSLAVTSAVKSFLSSSRSPMMLLAFPRALLCFRAKLQPLGSDQLKRGNETRCTPHAPCRPCKLSRKAKNLARPVSAEFAGVSGIDKGSGACTRNWFSRSVCTWPPDMAGKRFSRGEGRGDAVAMENSGATRTSFC